MQFNDAMHSISFLFNVIILEEKQYHLKGDNGKYGWILYIFVRQNYGSMDKSERADTIYMLNLYAAHLCENEKRINKKWEVLILQKEYFNNGKCSYILRRDATLF